MTHVVKIDILSGHGKMGDLHFNLKIIFHCMFIENACVFSKVVEFILKVEHIVELKFVKIFISDTKKKARETIFNIFYTYEDLKCHAKLNRA